MNVFSYKALITIAQDYNSEACIYNRTHWYNIGLKHLFTNHGFTDGLNLIVTYFIRDEGNCYDSVWYEAKYLENLVSIKHSAFKCKTNILTIALQYKFIFSLNHFM